MITLNGYKILEKLNEGKTSIVYRGVDQENKRYILKVLKTEVTNHEEISKLNLEYQIINNFNSEFIIRTYGIKNSYGNVFLVLEDFNGVALSSYIKQTNFDLKTFLEIAIKITSAITEIHNHKIIHEDIKPHNILFNNETKEIKIIDFGCASFSNSTNNNSFVENMDKGTINYISPEQTGRMKQIVDFGTDFYSLGITFYEILTGLLPFNSEDPLKLIHLHIAKKPDFPDKINFNIPKVISKIVMKLLKKNRDERYKNGTGLKADLEICLERLTNYGKIDNFKLGNYDYLEVFNIPKKIYGREKEVSSIMHSFEHISRGNCELVTISGAYGIGKSSLVDYVQEQILKNKCYFVSGKFDKLKTNTPYYSIIEALKNLIRGLLIENKENIDKLNEKIVNELGTNIQLIVDIIPELELIVGKKSIIPEINNKDSNNRFNIIFQKFIGIFATKDRPLIIRLDDVHWADPASIEIIKNILLENNTNYLLVIATYRINQSDIEKYISNAFDQLKRSNLTINIINLNSLSIFDINNLLEDIFAQKNEKVDLLAKIVYQKTQGNPFFLNEFLKSLYQKKLVQFKQKIGWDWDINEINKMQITDNVVELILEKIAYLSKKTQELLKLASCLGNKFLFSTLALVYQKSKRETYLDLIDALKNGIIVLSHHHQNFLHDKVYEAIYSMIPADEKKNLHYKIGNILLENLKNDSNKNIDNDIFEIVNQLNFGIDFELDHEQKYTLASLNIKAGEKAKLSNAYIQASEYFNISLKMIDQSYWQEHYEMTLSLYMDLAETGYLLTDFVEAEKLFDLVLQKAKTDNDKAKIYEIKVNLYITMNRMKQAIETGLKGLDLIGFSIPTNKSKIRFLIATEILKAKFSTKKIGINNLIDLPIMEDQTKILAMKLMIGILTAAYMSDTELMILLVLKMVNISLKYGNSDVSCYAYITYGVFIGFSLNEYQKGCQFGQFALDLNNKITNQNLKCKINFIYANLIYEWTKSGNKDIDLLTDNLKYGVESGDLTYYGFSVLHILIKMFVKGYNLDIIYKTAKKYFDFILRTKDSNIIDAFLLRIQLIQCLKGLTYSSTSLSDENFNEEKFIYSSKKVENISTLCRTYLIKLQLFYLFGDYSDAVYYLENIKPYIHGCYANNLVPEYYFYSCLTLSGLALKKKKYNQKKYINKIKKMQKKMRIWSNNCPENFLHKYLLIEAEIANLNNNQILASELYNESIELAHKNGFVQNQAIANELTAKFYFSINKPIIAKEYIIEAYNCYIKWGAKSKSNDLESTYPHIFIKENENKRDLTLSQQSERDIQLDMTTVIKASQILSGEIFLDKLMTKLMKIVIESAGAERGYLILKNKNELFIEAEESIDINKPKLNHPIKFDQTDLISHAIVNYVERTKKDVVVNDATNEGIFISDPYILKNKPKSIICMPIMKQSNLIGILYLENNLINNAFTLDRIEILRLLASQSAVSLENAKLYDEMRMLNIELEQNKNNLEEKVERRTRQLKQTQKKLIESAHSSGMAEMATGVLHNIGNILNSVNISNQVIIETLENSKLDGLIKANNMLNENITSITEFIQNDQKGKKLPQYYLSVGDMLKNEHHNLITESHSLSEKLSLIKDVISTQQHYAKNDFLSEIVNPINIIEDALSMQLGSLIRHGINIKKKYTSISDINVQKSKMINILINLIKNAKEAMENNKIEKILTIEVSENKNHYISIKISDNGDGIAEENLNKIFNHGFTTKKLGHGFGLHTCANAMTEMEGKLTVTSDGLNKGATFNMIFVIK
ncbi:MAG: AAA family ATPase [Candidatus Sericytochromatia bacterium]|nr:AAA family ATPase [Candidatus Sericytochromatia bacterium]